MKTTKFGHRLRWFDKAHQKWYNQDAQERLHTPRGPTGNNPLILKPHKLKKQLLQHTQKRTTVAKKTLIKIYRIKANEKVELLILTQIFF